jgi:hypothetical protein
MYYTFPILNESKNSPKGNMSANTFIIENFFVNGFE